MRNLITLALGLLLSATVASAHSDAFEPQFVDTLVGPYLAIQQGLAGDDLESAKAGANRYLEAMKSAPNDREAPDETANLSAPAKAIVEFSNIKQARAAFRDLSREVISLVEHIGTTNDIKLYVARCPMAFNNQGGSWLQSSETVANPFYGSMMLRCGSIQKQIAGEASDDHGKPLPSPR